MEEIATPSLFYFLCKKTFKKQNTKIKIFFFFYYYKKKPGVSTVDCMGKYWYTSPDLARSSPTSPVEIELKTMIDSFFFLHLCYVLCCMCVFYSFVHLRTILKPATTTTTNKQQTSKKKNFYLSFYFFFIFYFFFWW